MESTSFWNPESTVLESGIQYPGSGIHSMESRIQDCPGFPYMGRQGELMLANFGLKIRPFWDADHKNLYSYFSRK